ncbi:hypothetical protein EYF80_040889 [Liparis tanakae]|uniref:Uncharacterized protein n=1 Tax=Liparis tanakae TaxID=230148 RepID=A0A4Z2G5P8_9TELE|nr:hypothetical protein EYF80_040889 [Liparis tanakae]
MKGKAVRAELSSTVVFRDRDNPAASWDDTPLMMHRVTLLYSNGIINSAAVNEKHVISQCFERYFNREATKVQSTRLQTKEMVIESGGKEEEKTKGGEKANVFEEDR